MARSAHRTLMLRARRGEFCSAVEIAMIASVTRMTAHRWLMKAGIDVAAARLKYLAKQHQQHQETVAALSGQRPLSAQERRGQVLKAVKRLNDAQAQRMAKDS